MQVNKLVTVGCLILMVSTLMAGCKKTTPVVLEEIKLNDTQLSYEIPVQKMVVISQIENASTGYSWHYLVNDENILVFVKEEIVSTTGDKNIVGAPMLHTWKFKTLTPGTTTIKFAYCRDWEAKALESKIPDNPRFPRLKAFTARWEASIEKREYTITVQ